MVDTDSVHDRARALDARIIRSADGLFLILIKEDQAIFSDGNGHPLRSLEEVNRILDHLEESAGP
jgi:hypothetical protein